MRKAIELSKENVENGGGPFGAVIATKEGEIVATGVNRVTASCDPTAHAEVSAIRAAAAKLGTFNLSGYEIYTSCEPCPMCGGRGEVRTARTVCYSIMREIVRLCKQYQETKEFHIQASQTVIDMLLEEESQALELLQAFVEKPVHLEVEPSYTQEQFDVILA